MNTIDINPLISHGKNQLQKMRRNAEEQLVRRSELIKKIIDMSRGKPGVEQLNESSSLLELPGEHIFENEDNIDCRTYGGSIRGLIEARRLLSPLVGTPLEQVVVSGNSSIALIHDVINFAFIHGVPESTRPWMAEPSVKFLCPVPGYDYHFRLLESFGIEMINVSLTGTGPDMTQVEALVASDPLIKGFIGVPRFSNPTGDTYSPEVVQRLAAMPTAAKDFRLFWDNAYAVHHLGDNSIEMLANILDACERAAHPDRPFIFSSTSKITLPGSGLAVAGSSEINVSWLSEHMSKRSIGPDKINQLRHVHFLRNWQGIEKLMNRHASHTKPKFETVDSIFSNILGSFDEFGSWSKPAGGYFISLYTPDGCATKTIQRAKVAGVILTSEGSSFPYGNNPKDNHIRIAPTSLTQSEVIAAASIVALSLRSVACDYCITRISEH